MSQFVLGRRPHDIVGEGDVLFDVKIVRWIFDVFKEKNSDCTAQSSTREGEGAEK